MHYQETKYGFEYGSLNIQRCCSDEQKGWVLVNVKTKKNNIDIYATKTGKIRLFNKKSGKEILINE